jgi:putative MATE family efflux protein
MIVLALTQMLGVGTTTLISQAAGRKDQPHAEVVFNQSFVMSIVIAFGLGVVGFSLRPAYCEWLSADVATAKLAKAYLLWFLPGILLQFPLVALGSALRATGIIKPAVGFQVLSVLLNIVLAPLLIFGIGPWPKLGVTGAALATFISILIADVLMIAYFEKKYHYVRFRFPLFRPQTKIWKRMLGIGVPAGAEFLLIFVYIVLVYAIIRGFGPEAQAGFGVGARMMQALFLPVVALSFAVAPVVGQNFGGRRADRVRHSVYSAIGIASLMMLALTLIASLAPATLIRIFSRDPRVIVFGSEYLRIVSLNFISAGIIFTTSSVFQGIGNTLPPLFSSVTRLVLFDRYPSDVRQSLAAPARAAKAASIRRTGKFHSCERYGFVGRTNVEQCGFHRSPYTTLPPRIVVFTFTLRMSSGFRSKMLSLRMTMSASLPGVMQPLSRS